MNDNSTVTISSAAVGMEPIPFVRPALPGFESLSEDLREVVASGRLTKGRFLDEFEDRVARHLHAKHAVAVSSCTSGLMLTYRGLALDGEVIVPSFTFMATVTALCWAGLTPVFVDVDPRTTNVDPAAVEQAITPRTTAIVAVHNFGNPAAIEALEQIARRHGLKLIFDAAHGFGTLYDHRPVGPQGDAQVFSLSPTKLLVAGEGGIVATNDDALASAIRLGREYGNDGRYDCLFPGMNARMPELCAVVGLRSLDLLNDVAEQRNRQADRYREALDQLPGLECIEVRPQDRCSYKDFSIVIDPQAFGLSRNELQAALTAAGIDTRTYYDPPVHRQSAFCQFAEQAPPLVNTEMLAERSLSLPMGVHVDGECIDRIAETVLRAYYGGERF